MHTNSNKQMAVSVETGNQETTTALAFAWAQYLKDPGDSEAMDRLARELEGQLLKYLPKRSRSGILCGREGEIRQEALLLLLQRYLGGNTSLLKATKKQSLAEISQELRRSILGALQASQRKLIHKLRRELKQTDYCERIEDHLLGVCCHPSEHNSVWQLPYEGQRELVFAGLRIAIAKHLLPTGSAELVIKMIEENLTQSAMAEATGVSRQAVSQRLTPVRKYLKRYVEETEFPLQ